MTLKTTAAGPLPLRDAAVQDLVEGARAAVPPALVVCEQDRGESPFGWSELPPPAAFLLEGAAL
ncbi:hypothetical protein FSY75_09495 [Streptomyces sp. TR1341]|uniref:hypothetical protein n=1 Tax=Streptomyces sp. TR1341 TaxID=2601266 RepID=UPI00138AD24B|nr:hypothetical protein [Streptomyces sp. TR1341]